MLSNSSDPLTNLPFPTDKQFDVPRIYIQQEGSFQGTWIDAINASEIQKNIDYIRTSLNGCVKITSFQNFQSVEFLREHPDFASIQKYEKMRCFWEKPTLSFLQKYGTCSKCWVR